MILFIVEGEKKERQILNTLHKLFLNESNFIWSFKNNIIALYNHMIKLNSFEDSADTFQVLKELKRDKELDQLSSNQIESIYLFFDFDLDSISRKKVHCEQINQMLNFFSNETDKGKLYINYPMVESFLYIKQLPDVNYYSYCVKADIGRAFKQLANDFSHYKNTKSFLYNISKKEINQNTYSCYKGDINDELLSNWKCLNTINVSKANFLCNNNKEIPQDNNAISQSEILKHQIEDYLDKDEISVLFSFSLFLFDYFKEKTYVLKFNA